MKKYGYVENVVIENDDDSVKRLQELISTAKKGI
jgi:hypothetical protein